MKYVHIVETRLNEALTTFECSYDGSYNRRSHNRYVMEAERKVNKIRTESERNMNENGTEHE